jgi:hypothetical protein
MEWFHSNIIIYRDLIIRQGWGGREDIRRRK